MGIHPLEGAIKPGPNNPVGVVWIDINVEHYGIHGTPEPERVGHAESHGCVRLTTGMPPAWRASCGRARPWCSNEKGAAPRPRHRRAGDLLRSGRPDRVVTARRVGAERADRTERQRRGSQHPRTNLGGAGAAPGGRGHHCPGASGRADDRPNVVAELRRRGLDLPVDAAEAERMKGAFDEQRGDGSRRHEAVDILAPRGTPVRAVEDGTVAKLFLSKAGGITVYQFDRLRAVHLLLRAPRSIRGRPSRRSAPRARRRRRICRHDRQCAAQHPASAFCDLRAHAPEALVGRDAGRSLPGFRKSEPSLSNRRATPPESDYRRSKIAGDERLRRQAVRPVRAMRAATETSSP